LNVVFTFSQVRSDDAIEKQLKEKKEEIIFDVGTIVTYRPRDWNLFDRSRNYDGVIIGWHDEYDDYMFYKTCDMLPYLSEYWVYDFCVFEERSDNGDQRYYIILAENNTLFYAQQGMNIIYKSLMFYKYDLSFLQRSMFFLNFRLSIDMSTKRNQ